MFILFINDINGDWILLSGAVVFVLIYYMIIYLDKWKEEEKTMENYNEGMVEKLQ
mgnify:CR=1 FL=1